MFTFSEITIFYAFRFRCLYLVTMSIIICTSITAELLMVDEILNFDLGVGFNNDHDLNIQLFQKEREEIE